MRDLAPCSLVLLLGACVPPSTEDPDTPGSPHATGGWEATRVAGADPEGGFPTVLGLDLLEGGPDVFAVYVVRHPEDAVSSVVQDVRASRWSCPDPGCGRPAPIAELEVGAPTRVDAPLPSLAVAPGPSGPVAHVVRREKVTRDCDGDGVTYDDVDPGRAELRNLDLVEWTWDPDADTLTSRVIDANPPGTCHDRALSMTRHADGAVWTCFTYRGDGPDAVWCAVRRDDAEAWDTSLRLDNEGANEDHASYALREGRPFLGTHRRHDLDWHAIQLRDVFSDTPPVTQVGETRVVNHPSVAVAYDGRVHVVWTDGVDHNTSVRYATCSGALGCRQGSAWRGTGAESDIFHAPNLEHAMIAVDGEKQFVAFGQGAEEGGARVMVMERCGEGPWSEPEGVREPDAPTEQQLVYPGRPALALDRVHNVLHVAMVEIDADIEIATDGDAWWMHRTYEDCPR
jgi:hypothetical protein